MAKASVRIEGLPELKRALKNLGDAVDPQDVRSVLVKATSLIKFEAMRLAPFDPGREAEHGKRAHLAGKPHLWEAIFRSGRPRGGNINDRSSYAAVSGHARGRAPHAIMIEFGTSKMAAQPYFRPAIKHMRSAMASIIINGLRVLIRKASRRR